MIRRSGLVAVGVLALALGSGAALAKGTAKAKQKLQGLVNLNTATASQLDLLPGVGEKAAKEIIAYRQKQPFGRIEELVKVKGFGKKRYEKVRPYLATYGQNTLRAVPATGLAGRTPGGEKGGEAARTPAPTSHP